MIRAAVRIFLASAVLPLLAACNMGYGPRQDHSEFVSAKLTEDKHVLFSYHHFAYRPAAGMRAFPDGGIPKYVKDENLLGLFDPATGKVNILRREKNKDWQPGSGTFAVHSLKGNKALISQGGQLRGPFALGVGYLLLDLKLGTLSDLDLKADLAKHGRDTGQIYLADTQGTLVFITQSLAEASAAKRDREPTPEIWVRTAAGDYLKIAASEHYQETLNGEVIYWDQTTREHMAFSIADRQLHRKPEYKMPEYQDVTEGVILSSDRKGIQRGAKVAGEWRYETLALTPDMLK